MSTPERWWLWRVVRDGRPGPWNVTTGPINMAHVEEFEVMPLADHESALVDARTQERDKIADALHGDEAEAIRAAAIRNDIPPEDALAQWVRSGGGA